ncbi:MAG TPA: hypothetical protein VN253_28280 [Kofleriaceae bacterium]|nr:hypothetical protein [Kofleriaceae bacterium]
MRHSFIVGIFLAASLLGASSCADEQSSGGPGGTASGDVSAQPAPAEDAALIDAGPLSLDPDVLAPETDPAQALSILAGGGHGNSCHHCSCHCFCKHKHCYWKCHGYKGHDDKHCKNCYHGYGHCGYDDHDDDDGFDEDFHHHH